jgi:3-deoxy-manno-octulosonate cytidylyltransferase (CMP-KDO synthetase)
MSKACILIPARFQSSRFPGKPLATILGKPMIQRVYENCVQSGAPTYVVTDHSGIEDFVLSFGGKVLRVDDDVPSGSQRIALAYERFLKNENFHFIVNVQGDEPLLPGSMIKELIDYHASTSFDVTTLVVQRLLTHAAWKDPNVVKAVVGVGGRCLYFSRASIPFDRDGISKTWNQHVGVYSYRPESLKKFNEAGHSYLADYEQLEQLKGMDHGLSYGAHKVNVNLVGVDRPEDIKKVEELLK